jgi:hypothetical protein
MSVGLGAPSGGFARESRGSHPNAVAQPTVLPTSNRRVQFNSRVPRKDSTPGCDDWPPADAKRAPTASPFRDDTLAERLGLV